MNFPERTATSQQHACVQENSVIRCVRNVRYIAGNRVKFAAIVTFRAHYAHETKNQSGKSIHKAMRGIGELGAEISRKHARVCCAVLINLVEIA